MTSNNAHARVKWCFTINNPYVDPDTGGKIAENMEKWPDQFYPEYFKFLIYQTEIGANGTPHHQGYFELVKKQRFQALKKKVGDKWHLSAAQGTKAQNVHYCSKPVDGCKCKHCMPALGPMPKRAEGYGGPVIKGDVGAAGSGRRTDIEGVIKRIVDGEQPISIVKEGGEDGISCFRMYRAAEWLAQNHKFANIQPRTCRTDAVYLIGEQGCGKSRLVKFWLRDASVYYLSQPTGNQTLWWDGYEAQENVVIEEAGPWLKIGDIKNIVNEHPWCVQGKGQRLVPFVSKRVFFVSNHEPEEWYTSDQLGRRIQDPDAQRFTVPFGKKLWGKNRHVLNLKDWDEMEHERDTKGEKEKSELDDDDDWNGEEEIEAESGADNLNLLKKKPEFVRGKSFSLFD